VLREVVPSSYLGGVANQSPVRARPLARSTHVPSDGTLAGIAALGVGGLLLGAVNTLSGGRLGVPCLLHATTGLDCPLCGTTRMVAALLHGDLTGALRYNAPVLLGVIVVGYLWQSWVLERFGVRLLPRPSLSARSRAALIPVLVTLGLVFMVVRNLPWSPLVALYA
jgi:hypothetical protein